MSSSRFRRLARTGHAAFRRRRLLEAFFLAASLFAPVFVLALALGMLLHASPLGGWLVPLLTGGGLLLGLAVAWRHGRRHHLAYPEFLRHLEKRLELRENDLVNADELEEQIPALADPLSAGLAELSVDAGRERLEKVSFESLAPALSLRRPLLFLVSSVVVLAAFGALSPLGLSGSLSRIWRPGSFDLAPALLIQVEPGNKTIERGAAVLVRARFPGAQGEPRVLYRPPAGAWRSLSMKADSTEPGSGWTCTAVLPSILETTEYAVTSRKARSETYRLLVVEPLKATGYRSRTVFPDYTGLLPVQELRTDGNVTALLGSHVTLTVFPSRSQALGRMLSSDGTSIPLERAGQGELAAELSIKGPIDYRVELTAPETSGSRWLSDPFRVELLADRPPTFTQLAPEKSIRLPTEMAVRLDVDCLDDFGLTRLDLVYARNDAASSRINLSNWQGTRDARVLYPWNLEGTAMVPGDKITYHLELTDNDAVSGPKTTVGPECEIRFPSFDEMYAGVKEERDDQMQEAAQALEQQKQLTQDLRKVQDELKQNQALRWEQQEQLKDLAGRQEQIAEQVEKLSHSLDQSLDHMQQANLFTPEMLEKVAQINQLVKEIQDPAFKEYLARMQQAMQRLDRAAVDAALEKLQVTQQDLARNLDRTLEMLKQLQREQKLDELIQRAERLEEDQRRLSDQICDKKSPTPSEERKDQSSSSGKKDQENKDQSEKKDSDSGGAGECSNKPMNKEESAQAQKKQEELQQELDKLKKEMAALEKEAEEKWKPLAKEMQERKSGQTLSDAGKSMQSASQSMGSCQRKESLRFGRAAQKQLQSFSQSLRQAQSAMRGGNIEELARKLYALSNQLVRLSERQEALCDGAPGRSTRELAVDQQDLVEGSRKTLDQLYELGRESHLLSPELGRVMGEAVRRLSNASMGFSLGDRGAGMAEGRSGTRSLDETVLALLNANQQACNSSCSGGTPNPMARMRGLSGQQEGLNSDMSQMMGQMAGGQRLNGSGGSSEDQLLSMAARQEAIRKGLAEVQQSFGSQANILGRLGDIGKEMEEVVQQMKSRDIDPRILRRQEHILSRLLTAQRSLRKEGQKEERVSRTGLNPENMPSPPPVPDAVSPLEALRRAVLRGGQDPVPSDFRKLVETYFRSLAVEK